VTAPHPTGAAVRDETSVDALPPPRVHGEQDAAPGLASDGEGREPAPAGPRRGLVDVYAALLFLAGALWVTARGWRNFDGRLMGSRPGDQSFNEWMLANVAHAVTHLDNPFFSTLQNAPYGVNLMTNVGLQLPGLVLTPVTLLGGAALSYLVLITANLAGTAFAWYWVLSRHLVSSRLAAVVGGLICAFAPALISQSNGHPHITAQWLVPFIVLQVVRLADPARGAVRDGLLLGLLVALQLFVSLEVLLLVAVGCALAAIGYACLRPREAWRAAPRALLTFAIAGGIALLAALYPLWMMYLGPRSRSGHPGSPDFYALGLKSFVGYASRSLAGGPTSAHGLAPNTTEENSFFGYPVLVLALVAVIWLRRHVGVLLLAGTAVVAAVLAMGTTWQFGSTRTHIPAPYGVLQHVPPFDALVVARFALITTAALGILFAVAADRVLAAPRPAAGGLPVRLIAGGALLAALLPMAPLPLLAQDRPAVPAFVTSGDWREVVAPGRTLVPVPVDPYRSIRWGSAAAADFAVPQGYFIGPVSATDKTGRWGVDPQPTAALLTAVATGKRSTAVTAAEREQAAADVRFWRADAVVLDKGLGREADLRAVLDELYGPGRRIDDAWVWDVRKLTS
jgi:hypothetical protein